MIFGRQNRQKQEVVPYRGTDVRNGMPPFAILNVLYN